VLINEDGHNIQHSNEVLTNFELFPKVGKYQIHYCLKCFDYKNVVVASLDADIYSVVQGDMKPTNRLCQKISC
jgi:hypothetical protein